MAGRILRTALRFAPPQVRHVQPVPSGAAQSLVASVYDQVKREFGVLAPPVVLHSPAPSALAASWVILRETLLAAGLIDRATKEAVAAGVSVGNACPYCVDVHSSTLHGLVGGLDAVAISEGRLADVADLGMRRVAEWAVASSRRSLVARLEVPVGLEQLPELIGVAVTFQYYNRMVSTFVTESPFPPFVPAGARDTVFRLFGRLMRPAASRLLRPGLSLSLLPDAPLPDDLLWAKSSRTIAAAFARAAAAVSAFAVPLAVHELVTARLARWHGEPVGLSRSWVDRLVADLPEPDRPAGRLALLVALAPHQLDETVVAAFRQVAPSDAALVKLASWASLAAARRIGTWLAELATLQLRPTVDPPAA
jgi:AhpD family alkylhydroperoxidase